ncbi:type III PLP-dependent enzyme [Phaeovibrio sulfidiphilus]|uniref:ornithine decarboxylase n=1 Tax=Phaeovibrio sulfidiphilus TaxID=1220600 RepID=A0A8J7CPZ4_9PROT|nr:type III PLP-dependent enzyme [Phaeovibrio sulfidiphilus]MBE1237652.1 type III PLP-dependent enzyme [Phaeovibrio sulfidiphilus]
MSPPVAVLHPDSWSSPRENVASTGATILSFARTPEWVAPGLTVKQAAFLASQPQTPCVVIDVDVVGQNYNRLTDALPGVEVFYAVKANPLRPVLERLAGLGSSFDTASLPEIDSCLELGVDPSRISYGNTIKKARDIAAAHERGIGLFAFDSAEELQKIAQNAPGSKVFCRLFVENEGAQWPLSRKFGCSSAMVRELLIEADRLGLQAHGISFHVGSQQTNPEQWDVALRRVAELFVALESDGVSLGMINLGGGLPASYDLTELDAKPYGERILGQIDALFPNGRPRLLVEPGRYMTGNAGVLEAEVVLVSRKDADAEKRWVYVDAGRFNGLAETEGEAIRYPVAVVSRAGEGDALAESGPVILAGPTCDSVDILYDKAGYQLPLDLRSGDRLRFMATGAYTTTYAAVGFNGFAPITAHCV